ncbi:unnamed protein product [Rotaria sordida]|uniref:Uncharacterized protein n=1 Tax=Rotaria sordida TaxID=392033 RepID=A0A815BT17_9BILA|nr:unnamed protein product [Rotaria sordida]CAF1303810.1 unnamed protein product [Rotaria sordida]CAF1575958.1 unnamed protein product [Rotaria sordida]CAF4125158.1 unnamed protein product [Rotaria sordida]
MACCGLFRPKIKSKIKTNKNITKDKLNTINMWIENIEGPYELIVLPSKPPHKPKILTNIEEIAEAQQSQHPTEVSISTNQDKRNEYNNVVVNQKMKSRKHNLQYLPSDFSINEEIHTNNNESK